VKKNKSKYVFIIFKSEISKIKILKKIKEKMIETFWQAALFLIFMYIIFMVIFSGAGRVNAH
jgi:hypothetical protein